MFENLRGTISNLNAMHPVLGLALTSHLNTRGLPMAFKDKPYLVEMYTDFPNLEDVVVRKAVQTGVSELCIIFSLQRAGWANRIVAYCLPTYSIRDRFVQKRIDPLLQHVTEYRNRCPGGSDYMGQRAKKSSGNLKMKQFGTGTIMFLGSNTPGDFVEFSADTLIIDEYDQCDPTNLAKARDRLRASPYPQEVRLGNPTLPRVGISRLFDESDARQWFFKCDHCGERQPMDWFQNVVMKDNDGNWIARDQKRARHLVNTGSKWADRSKDIRPVCRRCHEPFVRTAEGALWVPKNPSRAQRGYTMSRLDIISECLWKLVGEWNEVQTNSDMLSAFYTSVLGVPFEFSGARLTQTMLADCAFGEQLDYDGGSQYEKKTVTCGIDVGSVININISTIEKPEKGDDPIRRCVWVGAVRTFEEVIEIIKRYRVDFCVIDAAPEMRKSQEVRDYFIDSGECVVWLCRFHPTPRVGVQKYGMRVNYQTQTVTVDRTAVFDATMDDIRENRRVFPEDVFTVFGWSDQMRTPVRVLNEKSQRIIWESGSSPDHYRLSDIYDRIALDLIEFGGTYEVV